MFSKKKVGFQRNSLTPLRGSWTPYSSSKPGSEVPQTVSRPRFIRFLYYCVGLELRNTEILVICSYCICVSNYCGSSGLLFWLKLQFNNFILHVSLCSKQDSDSVSILCICPQSKSVTHNLYSHCSPSKTICLNFVASQLAILRFLLIFSGQITVLKYKKWKDLRFGGLIIIYAR